MVRNARIKITIETELRPYTDGHWAVYDRDGRPVGFMDVEREHLTRTPSTGDYEADEQKAFVAYWREWGKDPMAKALEGFRIGLVGGARFKELLAVHCGREERKQTSGRAK
ncbi:hypothetical protein ACI2L4_25020 [Streptomyces sparsogenes]|uniref:hypothetical protein n=1 Tax=Streptomyces sparsogenes TaxID=67365 RepID=UPI00384A8BF4